MLNNKRKFIRYNINFIISSNEVKGIGINISKNGFGFITEEELVLAENVPFEAEINGYIFDNKKYSIKGKGRLLFSKHFKDDNNFYNGFQFIELDDKSKKLFNKILGVIKKIKNK